MLLRLDYPLAFINVFLRFKRDYYFFDVKQILIGLVEIPEWNHLICVLKYGDNDLFNSFVDLFSLGNKGVNIK